MQWIFLSLITISLSFLSAQKTDEQMIAQIFETALTQGHSYENLRELCKDIGPRLSGSDNAAKAVEWGQKKLQEMGVDRVFLQKVMVPHWIRGEKEKAHLVNSASLGDQTLNICALGGSISTDKTGVSAEIIEVQEFSELAKLGKEKIQGKIVFYNRPMNPTHINAFRAYSSAVSQRSMGAVEAAPYGAVAVIVRSMNLRIDEYPHTGGMRYKEEVTKIPAAAISTQDAQLLHQLLAKEKSVTVYMKMSCQTLPDAPSYNVVGEITGSEFPEEIIAVGGHLDSWDLGEGAHDDGAGCVQSMEVLRLFKAMKIKPKRTLRTVLFMNEENGLRGALEYARLAKENKEFHLAAIESDSGGFTPRGFTVDGKQSKLQQMLSWLPHFIPYGIYYFAEGRSGADVSQLKDGRATLMGFKPDSQRYFDYHHASTDVFEAINKRELELGSAAITGLVYLIDQHGLK